MSEQNSGQEKTEEASAHKLKKSKDDGQVARDAGLVAPGYRLLANVGQDGGQEVPHLHVHIFGGEPLGPMIARR